MSLRYLAENNSYKILYAEGWAYRDEPNMVAFLEDKDTGKIIISKEKVIAENLEQCLMKLGKRLIRVWENRKKSHF